MRRVRARRIVVLLLVAGASAPASIVSADAKPRPPNGVEPIGSTMWPKVAAQLAKNIAGDSFARDYSSVWRYLDPAYQKAVGRSHWQRCQSAHPAAPRSVKITKVSVSSATELAVRLPVLGSRYVQEVELQVRFTTPAAAGPQYAVVYTFWVEQAKAWTAVWLGDEYAAYKRGGCYVTPQGPPLY
jgi:hypothetical protein